MKLRPTKKIKVVVVDVDKTLTGQTTWYAVTEQLGGDTGQHAQIFTSYLNGRKTYQEMKNELFKVWTKKGPVTKDQLQKIFVDVHLKGEALSVFNKLQERGYTLVLISSSVDLFVKTVAKRFGIDHWYGNSRLIFDKKQHWVDFEYDREEAKLKVHQFRDFISKTKFSPEECIAIGDDENDIELFKIIPGIAVKTNSDHLLQVAWQEVKYLPKVVQLLESI